MSYSRLWNIESPPSSSSRASHWTSEVLKFANNLILSAGFVRAPRDEWTHLFAALQMPFLHRSHQLTLTCEHDSALSQLTRPEYRIAVASVATLSIHTVRCRMGISRLSSAFLQDASLIQKMNFDHCRELTALLFARPQNGRLRWSIEGGKQTPVPRNFFVFLQTAIEVSTQYVRRTVVAQLSSPIVKVLYYRPAHAWELWSVVGGIQNFRLPAC